MERGQHLGDQPVGHQLARLDEVEVSELREAPGTDELLTHRLGAGDEDGAVPGGEELAHRAVSGHRDNDVGPGVAAREIGLAIEEGYVLDAPDAPATAR